MVDVRRYTEDERNQGGKLTHVTNRFVNTLYRPMNVAHTTDAIPTQPSSARSRGTATISIMSMSKKTEIMMPKILIGADGTEKNRRATKRYPAVRVV